MIQIRFDQKNSSSSASHQAARRLAFSDQSSEVRKEFFNSRRPSRARIILTTAREGGDSDDFGAVLGNMTPITNIGKLPPPSVDDLLTQASPRRLSDAVTPQAVFNTPAIQRAKMRKLQMSELVVDFQLCELIEDKLIPAPLDVTSTSSTTKAIAASIAANSNSVAVATFQAAATAAAAASVAAAVRDRHHRDDESDSGVSEAPAEGTKRCRCKKSQCLKQYCECFKVGLMCVGCDCVGCHNNEEHEPERAEAMVRLNIQADARIAFKKEVEARGCRCVKSNCRKRYCECYDQGLQCSSKCRCQDCKNKSCNSHGQNHGAQNQQLYSAHLQSQSQKPSRANSNASAVNGKEGLVGSKNNSLLLSQSTRVKKEKAPKGTDSCSNSGSAAAGSAGVAASDASGKKGRKRVAPQKFGTRSSSGRNTSRRRSSSFARGDSRRYDDDDDDDDEYDEEEDEEELDLDDDDDEDEEIAVLEKMKSQRQRQPSKRPISSKHQSQAPAKPQQAPKPAEEQAEAEEEDDNEEEDDEVDDVEAASLERVVDDDVDVPQHQRSGQDVAKSPDARHIIAEEARALMPPPSSIIKGLHFFSPAQRLPFESPRAGRPPFSPCSAPTTPSWARGVGVGGAPAVSPSPMRSSLLRNPISPFSPSFAFSANWQPEAVNWETFQIPSS